MLFQISKRRTVITVLLASVIGSSTAWGAADKTPPTTPTNLRITSNTSYTVSLAWNASTDNSGNFSYRVRHSWGYEATLPKTQTSYTWTGNLEPRSTYSFFVYAVDAAGNKSKNSNTVTIRMPNDTTPPTKPIVSVLEVGSTHVRLGFSSTDDGPNIWFAVYKNGSPVIYSTRETSATITQLLPQTTYTFTVEVGDFGNNKSMSDPVTVTTTASNSSDTTPPTAVTNLTTNGMEFQDGETWLFWSKSTDNVDPQSLIRYDVYLNGGLDHSIVGTSQTVLYAVPGIVNTISVVAVDTAGNQAAPATITVDLR